MKISFLNIPKTTSTIGIASYLVVLVFFLSSCWAPRCPDKTCRVRMEHRHSDKVSGVFMGRTQILPPRMHYLWDKDKGERNPDTKTLPSGGDSRQSRKLRKKFPWERW